MPASKACSGGSKSIDPSGMSTFSFVFSPIGILPTVLLVSLRLSFSLEEMSKAPLSP